MDVPSPPAEFVARDRSRAAADFFDYEARLNTYLADRAMLVLCFYGSIGGRVAHPSVDCEHERHGESVSQT